MQMLYAEGGMGGVQHDRGRATTTRQRLAGFLQQTLRSPLRGLHPFVQLLHSLPLPNAVLQDLHRGLRPPGPRGAGPLQQAHGTRHHPRAVAEGVPVVRGGPPPSRRAHLRHQILRPVQGLLPARVLLRRALFPHLRHHEVLGEEFQPDVDLG